MTRPSHIPGWLAQLEIRLPSIRDMRQRQALCVETFVNHPPSAAVSALECLMVFGWRQRRVEFRIVLDAAIGALGADIWPKAYLEQVLAIAIQSENELVCALLAAPPNETDDGILPVPVYSTHRPMTLGERKSIASKPDIRLLTLALADPHPQVIAKLLCNPKITEKDVLIIASRRPNAAEVLRCVAHHEKWRMRPSVARAIVYNPYTPVRQAISVLHLLSGTDVKNVSEDLKVNGAVRRLAKVMLQSE